MKRAAFVLVAATATRAIAQPGVTPPGETPSGERPSAPSPPTPTASEPMTTPPATVPPTSEPLPTVEELADDIADLVERQRALESAQRRDAGTRDEVKSLLWLPRFITVFVDVGAFAVGGDGSGIRSDRTHVVYPRYAGVVPAEWVFLGDPLSTTINSLGEPADAANSRSIQRDTIESKGNPSLIVNSIGLSIGKDVGHGFAVAALAELMPRAGDDLMSVELAHIDYRPSRAVDLVLSAGKVDSVLGVEYRAQDAPVRVGVTPSLICRYTCGRPFGVQARLVRGPRGRLSASLSLTTGDNFDARFEPDQLVSKSGVPTASGHLQWMLPVGQGLELGVSGALGPQDGQADPGLVQWHLGFDARLRDYNGFDVTAEYVQGRQPGAAKAAIECGDATCLRYRGAYMMVVRRVNSWFTPYVRVDWRDAVHHQGNEFVYESHTLRSTIGVHLEVTSRILAKVEYTMNRELAPIPEFSDDVLTSSLVVATD